ncbi:hypothetical protein O6P43_013639 [Quillaja saponaria]|uniref:Uncharacterized protein n=1 Tax=Quillaja saponaria TaxID=32244 RepID=A0AAD7PR23_QUISA|nr:hypothetical protein O6P43_013639 [Quillaja saponaria]
MLLYSFKLSDGSSILQFVYLPKFYFLISYPKINKKKERISYTTKITAIFFFLRTVISFKYDLEGIILGFRVVLQD